MSAVKTKKVYDSSDTDSDTDNASESTDSIPGGYRRSIYVFHRSLRLYDNTGLIQALSDSEEVIPIFIFTPAQITSDNKFRSIASIRFMIDALIDLNTHLTRFNSRLRVFYGEQHEVIDKLLSNKKLNIDAVYVNMDYTPYALQREEAIFSVCQDRDVDMYSVEDYLLLPIDTVKTGSGTFYSVYTPFYKSAVEMDIDEPEKNNARNYLSSRIKIPGESSFNAVAKKIGCDIGSIALDEWPATRKEALKRNNNIKNHKNYADNRNDLTQDTTKLSPYIKFGLVSVREVYHKIKALFGVKHTLIAQLFWREFYFNLSYNAGHVLEGDSFRDKYDKITWKKNKRLLDKWKTGTTGVPIVDAGMRELVNSNYMHNRARLITSNYLVKHYFIDWRIGEEFYAEHLVDYDPSVNNGNWQWTSGSGADAQPYFRLMNPWSQALKHDPDCHYIKKWIPELADVPPEDIHDWQNQHQNYDIEYPGPAKEYDFQKLKAESKKVYSV